MKMLFIGLLTTPIIISAMSINPAPKSDLDIHDVTIFYHEERRFLEASYCYGDVITSCVLNLRNGQATMNTIPLDSQSAKPNPEIEQLLTRAIQRFVDKHINKPKAQQDQYATQNSRSSRGSQNTPSSHHARSNISEEDCKTAYHYQTEISTQASVQHLPPAEQKALLDPAAPCCKPSWCTIL